MKLATWNVNSLSVRLPQVLDWLQQQAAEQVIDALVLQETKTTDDKFPREGLARRVSRVRNDGINNRFNGLCDGIDDLNNTVAELGEKSVHPGVLLDHGDVFFF